MMDINEIRNLPEIKDILKHCEGFGRTWGTKGTYFHGSHITFITREAIVLIYQGKKKDSKICIANFVKDNFAGDGLALKENLMAILENYGIILEES